MYKLLANIVDSNPTDFFTFKKLRIFYFKIAHLFIGVMLKTEIFDILLHGKIGVGEVAVLLHGEIFGEVAVGEISDWGS